MKGSAHAYTCAVVPKAMGLGELRVKLRKVNTSEKVEKES